MFICRTCLPDLGGTGGAPPYGMPFQKHTCPLLISSSQFLCMMARKTVPSHPCQALITWVGGMVSLMQSKKPGLMASIKSSFSLRCDYTCRAFTSTASCNGNTPVKHEHQLLLSPEISSNARLCICCFCLHSW